jgi:transcription antitermination protein NusB
MSTSRREAGGGGGVVFSPCRAALFMLFQWDLTGKPLGSTYEGEVDEFARETAEAVAERASELDRRIDEATEDWPADRLGALERNILRIGIYELETGRVPMEVAIDEAVRLAKRFASDEAGKLVNGILGRIAREAAPK